MLLQLPYLSSILLSLKPLCSIITSLLCSFFRCLKLSQEFFKDESLNYKMKTNCAGRIVYVLSNAPIGVKEVNQNTAISFYYISEKYTCCAVLCFTALHCTVLHCTVRYRIVIYVSTDAPPSWQINVTTYNFWNLFRNRRRKKRKIKRLRERRGVCLVLVLHSSYPNPHCPHHQHTHRHWEDSLKMLHGHRAHLV